MSQFLSLQSSRREKGQKTQRALAKDSYGRVVLGEDWQSCSQWKILRSSSIDPKTILFILWSFFSVSIAGIGNSSLPFCFSVTCPSNFPLLFFFFVIFPRILSIKFLFWLLLTHNKPKSPKGFFFFLQNFRKLIDLEKF